MVDVWCDGSYTSNSGAGEDRRCVEVACVEKDCGTDELEEREDVNQEQILHPSTIQGAEDLLGNRVVQEGESEAGGGQLSSLETGFSNYESEFEAIEPELYTGREMDEVYRPVLSGQDGSTNLDLSLEQ